MHGFGQLLMIHCAGLAVGGLGYPGLSNVVECAPGVTNGSAPHGDEGVESLEKMCVRTIISVDGFPPDAPKARQHGMDYVQIPVGYEGVTEDCIMLLTRAIRDLPRPIYIHCFHGRERSPVAAAVALLNTGELTNDKALHVSAGCPYPQSSRVPKGRQTPLTRANRRTLRSTHKPPITRHVIEPVPVRTIRLGNLARVATFSESRVRDDHPDQIYEPRTQSERLAHKTHQNDRG